MRDAAFHFVDRQLRRCLKGISATHQGLWLGLLDHDALQRVNDRQYRAWKKYRSAEYNRSGLQPWESVAIDRHFADCRSLLVGAAGGGREVLALLRRGLTVGGFDCSSTLGESCRALLVEEGAHAEILSAPPGGVPEGLGVFDGAIVGWGGYMHIPGRVCRIDFLSRLHRHLAPGGPLLLSFFTRAGGSRFHAWVCGLANTVRRLRLERERVELGDSLVGTFDHHFTRVEIGSELAAAGFDLVHFAREPYGHAVGLAGRSENGA